MPLPKNAQNDKARIDDRRARVAAMYLEGKSQQAIAAVVGVSQMTVSKDIRAIREAWRASALRDFDTARAEELARLSHVEHEAWKGWDRSQTDAAANYRRVERASARGKASGKGLPVPPAGKPAPVVTLRTVEETASRTRVGDPRFLEVVLRCVEARMKLLGLADGTPVTVNQLVVPWDALWGGVETMRLKQSAIAEREVVHADTDEVSAIDTELDADERPFSGLPSVRPYSVSDQIRVS